ncbi:MAG: hypothetical protein QME66_13945, partial [Candidatus Eisenbacteria bacterium]|nr:hypothetical protein [Candidatus Eisenbacteria bacterium]
MKWRIAIPVLSTLMVAYWSWAAPPSHAKLSSIKNESEKTMKEKYEAVGGRLDAFQGTNDPSCIAQIGIEIDSLPLPQKKDPEWNSWREAKLALWLKALDKIYKTEDPTFDPEDVPHENVAPPPGTVVSAGASPDAIKDPELRKQYEQAIKANAEKAERYRLQKKLREIDKRWSLMVR